MLKRTVIAVLVSVALADGPLGAGQRQGGAPPAAPQGGAGAARPGGATPDGRARRIRERGGRVELVGSAVIRGRVVAADTGAPVRRAQVTAQGVGRPRTVTTDGNGRFELRELPAGAWTLQAAKAGYVTLRHGQRRSFESVPPLQLADGQRIDADFALPRGAAIVGRIFDEFGEPLANARVQVLRQRMVRGRRQLSQTGITDTTDDTGAYRLYGLAPGQYFVAARGGTGPIDIGTEGSATYAPTYFPGTINLAEAQRITVAVGDEQPNVSFGLLPVRTVRISGTVVTSSGAPVAGGVVNLTTALEAADETVPVNATGRIQGDGSFSLPNVIPGSYTLVVTTGIGFRRGGTTPPELAYMPLTVGADVAGLVVTTTPGTTLTGTVVADGAGATPALAGVRVQAEPQRSSPGIGRPSSQVAADGTFTLPGLVGPMLLRVEQVPAGWMLARIEMAGADVTDRSLDFSGGERAAGVRVVLTDRIPEVRGVVAARRASPSGYNVVVFADDPAKWSYGSRYVRTLRSDADGTFSVSALPPYDRYLAVAVDYLEDGEFADPEFLQRIRTASTAFALSEGGRASVDLKLVER